jgi:hypothetical protein
LHGSLGLRTDKRSFLRATQEIAPPGSSQPGLVQADRKPGCSLASFDASSNLLATKLDDSPTTLWIWDTPAAELRAVLIFHSPVDFQWHPSVRELLLVSSQDDSQQTIAFVWDPLSGGPKDLPIQDHLPTEKGAGKVTAAWINWQKENAALMFSDAHHYCLSSLSDAETMPGDWADHKASTLAGSSAARHGMAIDGDSQGLDDSSVLDDTFSFKHG